MIALINLYNVENLALHSAIRIAIPLDYFDNISARSASAVVVGLILNFSTRILITFGDKKAGNVGLR